MYLKNNSNFQCGLTTKKDVLTINPGDVVFVLDADVMSINSKLEIATEEEYFTFLRNRDKNIDSNQKDNKQDPAPVVHVEQNETKSSTKNEEQKVEEKETKEDKEDKDTTTEMEKLEAKLEQLKTQWQNTTRASKKASLQKQIKEVQEQINKLK